MFDQYVKTVCCSTAKTIRDSLSLNFLRRINILVNTIQFKNKNFLH